MKPPLPLSPFGFLFLFLVGVALPVLAIQSYRKLQAGTPLPPRQQLFIQTCTIQLLLLALSLVAAKEHWIRLLSKTVPGWSSILAAAVFLAIAVGTAPLRWRMTKEERRRRLFYAMPQTGREQALWCGLCVLVGISEEVTYRATLYGLLLLLMGNMTAAVFLASVIFAVNHAVQGWRAVVYIFFFALAFHGMVWLAGSLYVAIAAHAAYDIAIGFIYGKLGRAEFGTGSPVPAQA